MRWRARSISWLSRVICACAFTLIAVSASWVFSFSSTSNVLNANEIHVADLYLNGTLTVNEYRVTPNLLSNLIALVLAANPSFQF